MEYELGKAYELQTNGIFTDTKGYNYISLRGLDENDNNEYRVYNIMKCQQESLPPKIYVKVRQIDAFGRMKLIQDEQRVLQEHYQKGTFYLFSITSSERDRNGKHYYIIEDDFAAQRYYTEDEKYSAGDDIKLELHHIDDKGYLCFKEVEYPIFTPQPQVAYTAPTDHDGHYYVKYGPEGKKVEYKSSIAFLPGGDCDIDKQMINIIKALTAMMNAEGGKLVIGVNDKDQEIMGIKHDFEHLNDGEYDKYAGSYNSNHDGYKLKIMNELRRTSGSYAGSLIEKMDIKSKGGKEYCVIDILPAVKPIWMSGNKLYQRQENTSEQLFGDNLTHFVVQRMNESAKSMAGGAQSVAQLDTEKLEEILRRIINLNKHQDIQLPPPPQRTIDYWVVWDEDGRWRRQREPADTCFMQVPFYNELGNPRLVFCYGNNRVVTMDWRKVRAGVNLNMVQGSLWNTDKPTHIFIADTNDLLYIKSIDCHGTESIKLHALTDFTPVQAGGAQGAPILPENTKVLSYAMVDAEHLHAVNGLLCKRADRSRSCGVPVTTEAAELSKQIAYIEQLLKQQ